MVKKVLNRKFLRGLKMNFIQLLSITLMLILGVAIYIGINSTWRSLEQYVVSNYQAENKADIELLIEPTVLKQSDDINNIPNILQVEERFISKVSIKDSVNKELLLNAIDDNNILNDFTVVEGKRQLENFNCVLDRSFAMENEIGIGDKIVLVLNGVEQEFEVTGLAVSSSYLYMVPDATTVVPNHDEYGFVYVSKDDVLKFTAGNIITNNILVRVSDLDEINTTKNSLEKMFATELISINEVSETLNDLATSQKIAQYKTIGNLFPVVFFAIAMLMSFTTMYRLIDKERAGIGIMKALGYGSKQIMLHYLNYGFYIGIFSSVIGIIIGWKLIPSYIWNFFRELFDFEQEQIILGRPQAIMVILLCLVCTCVSTLLVFYKIDGEVPSALLREKGTTKGKKIFLDRLSRFWNRINMSKKLTLRQMFNSKVRMFMTVLGVLGCTALLLSALGIQDTVDEVVTSVYEKTYAYDTKIFLNEDKLNDEFYQIVEEKKVELMEERSIFINANDKSKSGVIHVIADESDYINLYSVLGNKAKLLLSDDSFIITKRSAEIFNLEIGDTVTFRGSDNEIIEAKISDIVELSIGQGFYVTQGGWEKLNQSFSPTSLITKESDVDEFVDFETKRIETSTQKEDFLKSMNSTQSMVNLLILSACLLLIVVLYNLGFLNFTDRERDLATLSVLGFKFNELKKALSSENTILSALGIILGLPIGNLIHQKIFANSGMGDELAFLPVINLNSYAITVIFTLILILFVTYICNRKINRIKMTEALKSVD